MFAVYAKEANFEDPLASVVVGERPDPILEDEGRHYPSLTQIARQITGADIALNL